MRDNWYIGLQSTLDPFCKRFEFYLFKPQYIDGKSFDDVAHPTEKGIEIVPIEEGSRIPSELTPFYMDDAGLKRLYTTLRHELLKVDPKWVKAMERDTDTLDKDALINKLSDGLISALLQITNKPEIDLKGPVISPEDYATLMGEIESSYKNEV